MGIFGEIGAVLDIYKQAKESQEFIRDYKGERIRIRKPNFSMPSEEQDSRQLVSYIIEGTVEDTTTYPPGFELVDVEEFVLIGEVKAMYGADSRQPLDKIPGRNERQDIRRVDEKYVSFHSIDDVEVVEVAEQASGPFEGKESESDEE